MSLMSSIDELSKVLGEMQSDMKHVRVRTDDIHREQKDLNEKVIINGIRVEQIDQKVKEISPKVERHEELINKSKGGVVVATGLAGMAGFVGGIIGKILF